MPDSATGFFGTKVVIQTSYQTFSLKLYKEQTPFFYFLLQALDRGDACYQTVPLKH